MSKKAFAVCGALGLALGQASAQLAITEAMSSASTNLGTELLLQLADYWELTNFGTNDVDLTGYRWNDNAGGLIGADPTPFTALTIAAGESIIFYESNATTIASAQQFRDWWGTNLPANLKIIGYVGNGLSSTGDGIRLWGPNAASDADVIDRIDFFEALRGSSFTYDPQTGVFGLLSTNSVGGAFKAETRDDVGSPGTTTGPVPLTITQQPTNTSVNPGDTAIFTVVANGMPRPSYQWYFNGSPIEGARFSTLFVTNAQVDKLGQYRVEMNNGASTAVSSNAMLSLNFIPEPPAFTLSPKNQSVFVAQSVTFSAMASGTPQPAYQWRFEGTNIQGATSASYTIPSAALADTGNYSVVASNVVGQATNAATLMVTRRPRLVITEIMPAQSTNGPFRGHNDWWELTNLDDFTVDLSSYRFDDSSATLAAAVTLTNNFSIAPGESIVFVENMTPEEFRSWWGSSFMRSNQQIITYRGAGLSLSSAGDAVNVWNSGATENFDTIASEVFSTATLGVSFRFDPDAGVFGELSAEGLHGAWVAPENGDIGSPGFTRNPPEPRILRFGREATGYTLTWTTETNVPYAVQFKDNLNATTWNTLTTLPATGPFLSYTNTMGGGQGYYQIRRQP
jgi:hypothetical protein